MGLLHRHWASIMIWNVKLKQNNNNNKNKNNTQDGIKDVSNSRDVHTIRRSYFEIGCHTNNTVYNRIIIVDIIQVDSWSSFKMWI